MRGHLGQIHMWKISSSVNDILRNLIHTLEFPCDLTCGADSTAFLPWKFLPTHCDLLPWSLFTLCFWSNLHVPSKWRLYKTIEEDSRGMRPDTRPNMISHWLYKTLRDVRSWGRGDWFSLERSAVCRLIYKQCSMGKQNANDLSSRRKNMLSYQPNSLGGDSCLSNMRPFCSFWRICIHWIWGNIYRPRIFIGRRSADSTRHLCSITGPAHNRLMSSLCIIYRDKMWHNHFSELPDTKKTRNERWDYEATTISKYKSH